MRFFAFCRELLAPGAQYPRFWKIKGEDTLEAKNSKIGTRHRRRFRFSAYCRELRAPKVFYIRFRKIKAAFTL